MHAALATIYGEERGKPMPSKNHAIVQSYLTGALFKYRDKLTVLSGGNILDPGTGIEVSVQEIFQ